RDHRRRHGDRQPLCPAPQRVDHPAVARRHPRLRRHQHVRGGGPRAAAQRRDRRRRLPVRHQRGGERAGPDPAPPSQATGCPSGDGVTTLWTTDTGDVVVETVYGALRGASGALLPADPLPAHLAAGATARREKIRNSARRSLPRRRAATRLSHALCALAVGICLVPLVALLAYTTSRGI